MIHPPCKNLLCKIKAHDGREYYRSACRYCGAWIGGEKDLSKMPASELARAHPTTEQDLEAARQQWQKKAETVYSKEWYAEKGVRTI